MIPMPSIKRDACASLCPGFSAEFVQTAFGSLIAELLPHFEIPALVVLECPRIHSAKRRSIGRHRRTYIPCGPRFMAATPVRQTSTRPSGFMIAMNCSILETLPVISKMKCSVLASITLARNASASRSASTR